MPSRRGFFPYFSVHLIKLLSLPEPGEALQKKHYEGFVFGLELDHDIWMRRFITLPLIRPVIFRKSTILSMYRGKFGKIHLASVDLFAFGIFGVGYRRYGERSIAFPVRVRLRFKLI